MSRRDATITIQHEGRDKGKTFTIQEMPAARAEEFFIRCMMLLAKGGADLPQDFEPTPYGFARIGLQAFLKGISGAQPAEVKLLMHEMMSCVTSYIPPNGIPVTISQQIDEQIEEVVTRLILKEEVVSLHLGFSIRSRIAEFRETGARMMVASGLNIATLAEPSE